MPDSVTTTRRGWLAKITRDWRPRARESTSEAECGGSTHMTKGAACEAVLIDFPEHDLRQAYTARDPYAVVDGVQDRSTSAPLHAGRFGSQDKFGSKLRPGGGVLGGISAVGGGTEHQGNGTPHLHLEAHVASAYQFDTLDVVVSKL